MSHKDAPRITALLNRAKALIEVEAGTLTELAAYLGQSSKASFVKAKRWVDYREAIPSGEDALGILEWVHGKLKGINAHTVEAEKFNMKFHRALKRINKQFPVRPVSRRRE